MIFIYYQSNYHILCCTCFYISIIIILIVIFCRKNKKIIENECIFQMRHQFPGSKLNLLIFALDNLAKVSTDVSLEFDLDMLSMTASNFSRFAHKIIRLLNAHN